MADADDKSLVEYECRDYIATITLNRPDKLNAVNDEMVRELSAALKRFDADNEARVAILCGRGRAFARRGYRRRGERAPRAASSIRVPRRARDRR